MGRLFVFLALGFPPGRFVRNNGQVAQLVRISGYIDRHDPAAVDLQGRGLHDRARFDRNEAGQPIEEGVPYKNRRRVGEFCGQLRVPFEHSVQTRQRTR